MKEFIQNKISIGEVLVFLAVIGLIATIHIPRQYFQKRLLKGFKAVLILPEAFYYFQGDKIKNDTVFLP